MKKAAFFFTSFFFLAAFPAFACSTSVSPSSVPVNTDTPITVTINNFNSTIETTNPDNLNFNFNNSNCTNVTYSSFTNESWATSYDQGSSCQLTGFLGTSTTSYDQHFVIHPTATGTVTINSAYGNTNSSLNESCSSSLTVTTQPDTIAVSPSSSTVTVGTPFNATIVVSGGNAFNAAQAHVTVSSNLSITGIHSAPTPACNFQYTQTPTTSDPSFAGAIYGSSSTNCNVYTVTLTPNATGTGTITLTNGKIKSYADSSEILSSVQNGSFSINAASPTPTPTPPLSGLTFTSPTKTYNSSYTLTGTKDATTTTVFVNGSSTGVTYPTSTTWQATETLTLGSNNTAGSNTFTAYGTDGNGNQTATISTTVSLHTLGDINGDGVVDLTDASLFAVDYGKTDPSTFTYVLSDMNGDGAVDLTDLSILAKLESQ